MNDQDRIFRIEKQSVVMEDFPAQGFILDIGGGGDGVIGQPSVQTGKSHPVGRRKIIFQAV